jgi:SAM-dependent methyltransferase
MSAFFVRHIAPLARPRGKEAFLRTLQPGNRVLDVGCGNNSPIRSKQCAPLIHYIGLDVGDYNQRTESIRSADEYIITSAEDFASQIEARAGAFDATISSHNLEHCNQPERVLRAICTALKPGGRMYLSFPSEASVHFPRRKYNTLNFFDDPTHRQYPRLSQVLSIIEQSGMRIDFAIARHRPFLPMIIGLLLEPISYVTQRAMPFGTTWSLYGFETVIWATKH